MAIGLWVATSAPASGTPQGSSTFPNCDGTQVPAITRAELKSMIAKSFTPWVAPAAVDRFFVDHSVIVTPAQLREGHRDLVAYASGKSICGTAGCNAFVLEERSTSTNEHPKFVLLTKIQPARLPIKVLPTQHHGWRDIGVQVAGGGIKNGYTGALSYDGKSYESNPTLSNIPRVGKNVGQVLLGLRRSSQKQCQLR